MAKLKVGDKAPTFSLEDQDGNKVSLKDFAGEKLLVYFYPRANTPGCTRQSCAVKEAMPNLKTNKMKAVGISPDKPASQKKFDDKYSLGFPLLSDIEKTVAKAYGAYGEKKMFGKISFGIVRSSFLIDEKGKILGAWYKVKPEDTVPKALALMEK